MLRPSYKPARGGYSPSNGFIPSNRNRGRNRVPVQVETPRRILTFNDLNLDCKFIIFSQFPVQKVIQYRVICHHWEDVIALMLQRKKSLKLFGSKDDVFLYLKELPKFNLHRNDDFVLRKSGLRDDDLVCHTMSAMIAIPRMFPNLKRLSICHYVKDYPWQLELPNLLPKLNKLESLTLFGTNSFNQPMPPRFWSVVNAQQLKELHLVDNPYFRLPFDMWGLNSLTKFTICEYSEHIGHCIQMLSIRLTHLVLDNVVLPLDHFRACFKANPAMARNITHFTVGSINRAPREGRVDAIGLFRTIAELLVGVTHLDVLLYSGAFLYEVTRELGKMPKLTQLNINTSWTEYNHLMLIGQCPPMPKLTRLYYKDYTVLTEDHFLREFPRIFPNLEFAQLETLKDELLQALADANVYRHFRHLNQFVPVGPVRLERHNWHKVNYVYAGRHEDGFRAHMYEELPYSDQVENKHDESLDGFYSEGEGDDEDMIRAALH